MKKTLLRILMIWLLAASLLFSGCIFSPTPDVQPDNTTVAPTDGSDKTTEAGKPTEPAPSKQADPAATDDGLESALDKSARELEEAWKAFDEWYSILQEDNIKADGLLKSLDTMLSVTEKEKALFQLQNVRDQLKDCRETGASLEKDGLSYYMAQQSAPTHRPPAISAEELQEWNTRVQNLHYEYNDLFALYDQTLEDVKKLQSELELEDFIRMANWDLEHFIKELGVPDDDNSEQTRWEHIWFQGHEGHLRVFWDDDHHMNCLSWTSYTSSEELYHELLDYMRSHGKPASTRHPKDGQVEEGTTVRGREIFVGYEDSSNGQYTYLFAEY